jgi:ATP-dependent exoDNAse (exonuclease V) beta subunit
VFDRVVIERDLSGRAKRVTVYDFKTDRRGGGEDTIRGVAERYRGQLELYGRVAARLTGLAVERVRVEVVLTAIGRRVRLEG